MRRLPAAFQSRGLLLALLLAAAMGCDGGSLPPPASPDEARTALRAALEAWQKGESTEALAQRTPPVYFNDPRARAGAKLLSYKLEENHTLHGQSVRMGTTLSLKFPDGTTKDRKTTYLVDTTPTVVIVAE